jgi:hypothetical protein
MTLDTVSVMLTSGCPHTHGFRGQAIVGVRQVDRRAPPQCGLLCAFRRNETLTGPFLEGSFHLC